jgi:hypothetical protein
METLIKILETSPLSLSKVEEFNDEFEEDTHENRILFNLNDMLYNGGLKFNIGSEMFHMLAPQFKQTGKRIQLSNALISTFYEFEKLFVKAFTSMGNNKPFVGYSRFEYSWPKECSPKVELYISMDSRRCFCICLFNER